jgi:DNA-binding NarL/FixJ family response regulator
MSKIKIFLAEGENHVRQAIHLSLDHMEGITLIGEARQAESLLAQIAKEPPDFLLLDWHLPGMNPQRMLPVIRRFCPDTKIIATGMQSQLCKLALAYGTDAYLSKNLAPDEFLKKLTYYLNLS